LFQPHLRVTPKETREFTSHKQYEWCLRKHSRSTVEPQQKFRRALTANGCAEIRCPRELTDCC